MPDLKKAVKPAVTAVLLHSLFASYRLVPVLEDYSPLTFFLPMGEFLLIFVLLYRKEPNYAGKIISFVLTGFLIFFLFGELFYRFFYLERFDMFSDMRLIPNFFVMLLPESFLTPGATRVISVLFTLAVIGSLSLLILKFILRSAGRREKGIKKGTVLILAVLIIVPGLLFPLDSPVVQTAGNLIRLENNPKAAGPDLKADTPEPVLPADSIEENNTQWVFPGIRDSSIHIVVVESYGAVLFQRPEYTEHMLKVYKKLQPVLNYDGWSVKTGYVRSPAFGGRSWLADSSLLTGIQIETQKAYDDLTASGEPAYLLSLMEESGYTSFYAAPGSTRAAEDWKKAYPFDTYILRSDFGYEGPNVAFGTLTDQFLFDTFARDHLIKNGKQFVFYLLVSSHTPFERIPVFKEDWNFSLRGKEYNDGYIRYFENNWLTGNELAEGYLAGISYSIETSLRYLTERLSSREFMLIIGDHQPRRPVSPADSGYPVIFHIVTPRSWELNFPESWNLSSGLIPPELPEDHENIPRMASLTFLLEQLIKQP